MRREEAPDAAGIFASDKIYFVQDANRTDRDIIIVTDGHCDDVKHASRINGRAIQASRSHISGRTNV